MIILSDFHERFQAYTVFPYAYDDPLTFLVVILLRTKFDQTFGL